MIASSVVALIAVAVVALSRDHEPPVQTSDEVSRVEPMAPASEVEEFPGLGDQHLEGERKTGASVWLVGTIVSVPANNSMALIADANNPGGANYGIGDELPDGSLLQAVYENEAHLTLGAENRILYIDGFDGTLRAAEPESAAQSGSGWRGDYEDATYNDQTEED